jgi:hypothetical protein
MKFPVVYDHSNVPALKSYAVIFVSVEPIKTMSSATEAVEYSMGAPVATDHLFSPLMALMA